MDSMWYVALMVPGILGFVMVLFTPVVLKAQEDRRPQQLKKRRGSQGHSGS